MVEYAARRDLMCAELDRFAAYLTYVRPQATYFVFPRLQTTALPRYRGSLDLAHDLIEHAGVAVVPGIAFGPDGEHHLRLSFGRARADIATGVQRLGHYLATLC
jgi:aminotransferase